jgi:hypothetical protein
VKRWWFMQLMKLRPSSRWRNGDEREHGSSS